MVDVSETPFTPGTNVKMPKRRFCEQFIDIYGKNICLLLSEKIRAVTQCMFKTTIWRLNISPRYIWVHVRPLDSADPYYLGEPSPRSMVV
jgi:hypothetical protein